MARKAGAFRQLVLAALATRLRILDERFRLYGDIEKDDAIIQATVRRLLPSETKGDAESETDSQGAALEKLLVTARADADVKRLAADLLLAKAFVMRLSGDQAAENAAVTSAREFIPDTQLFDGERLTKRYQEVSRSVSEWRDRIAERGAVQFEVTGADLATALALLTPLFVVSGYFYTHFLLNAVGIDASLFLTLGDYLAASIDQIRITATAAGVGFLALLVAVRRAARKGRLERERSLKAERYEDVLMLILIIAVATTAVVSFVHGTPNYRAAGILGLILVFPFASYLARSFKDRLRSFCALVTVGSFAVHLAASLGQDIEDLKAGSWPRTSDLRMTPTNHENRDWQSLTFFAGSERYLFALDAKNRTTYVIPRDEVGSASASLPSN